MTRPEFPSVIDNSMIKAFRSCAKKFEGEYIQHWKSKSPSVHLHAGKSFASGLEAARIAFYLEGKSAPESVGAGIARLLHDYGDFECPDDSAKSALRMAGALEYYFSVYPLGQDTAIPLTLAGGKRAIEFSFLEPINYKHPTTGDPILFSGRFDMAAEFAGGRFGVDEKTTSSLGKSWTGQWELDPQPTAYTWGAASGGLPLDGFLVRGISILKTKYDHAQCVTYRPAWRLDRWYAQVLRDLSRMEMMWREGFFDWNEGHACNDYGGCTFQTVCQAKDPSPWLAMNFEQRRWNPVTREEELL